MQTLQPLPPPGKSRGIPLWAALLALVAVTLVGLAAVVGVFYYMNRENAKFRAETAALKAEISQHELARQKGAEDDKLTKAINLQHDVLDQTRAATNALEQLLREVSQLTADATALKSNEDGKRVAVHTQLVAQASVFYETQLRDVPPPQNIITRLEAVRRIQEQVLSRAGTAYEPEAELAGSAQSAALAANQDLQRVARVRAFLSSLIRESKIKYTTGTLAAGSPTLEAALKEFTDTAAASTRHTLAEQTSAAKTQADRMRSETEAEKILEQARADAAKIRAEAADQKAAVERDIALMKARQQKEDTETKVAVETVADDARKIELRKKAADPQIQVKLAPFITPGYWQLNAMTLEKKPLSFTKLKSSGALEPTVKGGSTMATIVSSLNDKVRPRWKINSQLYIRSPEAIERIKEAQTLLTDLGPVLVEMKLLEP